MPEIILMGWDDTNKLPVRVKVTADGKLIINPAGFLENPPTEDEDKKAPTSEWAYDHDADVAAHHAKYTDDESRAAIGNQFWFNGIMRYNLNAGYHAMSYLQMFYLRWSAASGFSSIIQSTNGSVNVRITGYEDGVGSVEGTMTIYDGSANKLVIHAGTFQAFLATLLENPPTEDVADKAPTSEWAFDHDADASRHHAKYTDQEATESFHSRFLELTTGTITDTDVTNVNFILFNTGSGNITLKGLSGGSYGKMIFCLKNYDGNSVDVIHYSGDAASGDKIATTDNSDQSIGANLRGAFWLVYYGGYWTVARSLP